MLKDICEQGSEYYQQEQEYCVKESLKDCFEKIDKIGNEFSQKLF
jgi:hypothetical protein